MGAVPGLHPTMTKFLQTRATELKTTDKAYPFFDGDLAWINIQGGWDLTLGYYEEYHSPLGTTAIMEGFLGVVDEARNRKAAEFAKKAGADAKAFDECYKGKKTLEAVRRDADEAAGMGISGTPAFVVNGQLVSGADEKQIRRIVEDQLKKVKRGGEKP